MMPQKHGMGVMFSFFRQSQHAYYDKLLQEKARASIAALELGLKPLELFTKLKQTDASRHLWVAAG